MPLPVYQSPMKGRQLSASDLAKLQRDVQSLMRPQAGGAGMTFRTSPFGHYLQDNRPDAFPAIIVADSSGSTSGQGSGPARNQSNAYAWREAMPMLSSDDYVLVVKPGGRFGSIDSRPAMQANGASDLQEGTHIRLYPGTGQPDWYYFYAGESPMGSGSDRNNYNVTCNDDGSITVTRA